MPGWGAALAEIGKLTNNVVEHKLKPAVEKMRDIRFAAFKKWRKWKKQSNTDQAEREAEADKLRR